MSFSVLFNNSGDHLLPPEDGRTASKVVNKAPDARVVNIALAQGACLSEHKAAHPIFVHVLSGEIEFTVGESTTLLGAGGLVAVDRNVAHAVRAVAPSSILITFLPAGSVQTWPGGYT